VKSQYKDRENRLLWLFNNDTVAGELSARGLSMTTPTHDTLSPLPINFHIDDGPRQRD